MADVREAEPFGSLVTSVKQPATAPIVLADLRLAGRRSFAVLLLLLATVLGGAVEAAACEPEAAVAAASAQLEMHADGDRPHSDGAEQHGMCVHGHCHHGSQALAEPSRVATFELAMAAPVSAFENVLEPLVGDTPKRPPRA